MANHKSGKVFATFDLAITAQQSDANVKVNIQSIQFSSTVKVSKLSTKQVSLPDAVEMRDSGLSTKTVQITSDADISVVAFNDKLVSGDSSIVLPTTDLDTEYVVFTPNTGPTEMDKVVAIINGKDANTIEIVPYKNMQVKGFDFWQGLVPLPPPDPCEKVKCREKEECREGVCVHTSKETCTALGDPHYKTFDGKRFDFQGTCTYIIATTIDSASGLTPFTILTKNDHRGNQRVAYIRTVTVTVYGQTVIISKARGIVQVNGQNRYLPVTLADGKLRVMWSGWYAVLITDFGLEVKYDWDMKLYITAPSSYFRSLGGLCGNYNGDRQDDFTDLKGTKISTVIEFAKSWKVKDGDLFCHDDCVGECPSCSETLQEKYRSETFCGLMAKNDGPFSSCHGTIEPNMYIDNCVYDVCINKGYKKSLCDNME
ncbi:hypothetical protein Z043_122517, partial [Scleropages formosus]